MNAKKEMHYAGRGVDLDKLRQDISSYLQSDGFKIQQPKQGQSRMLIQAQKGGFLRGIISAERAMNILIEGTPDDFTIQIGIGKWLQNIAVTAVETLLITELFLPLDVAEMAWNFNVENKIAKRIDEIVQADSTKAEPAMAGATMAGATTKMGSQMAGATTTPPTRATAA